MLRELGALMTAILLAGRSGAAFAAEIGTMRVNEEINALTTMGSIRSASSSPPRVIAAVLMTPLLTLFANLVGLLGGAFTMLSFGIPFVTFVQEVEGIVSFPRLHGRLGQVVRVRAPRSPASAACAGCRPARAPPRSAIPRPGRSFPASC